MIFWSFPWNKKHSHSLPLKNVGWGQTTFPNGARHQLRHQCLAALYNLIINEMATDRYLENNASGPVLFYCIGNGVERWASEKWPKIGKGHESHEQIKVQCVWEKCDGEPLGFMSKFMGVNVHVENKIYWKQHQHFFEFLAFLDGVNVNLQVRLQDSGVFATAPWLQTEISSEYDLCRSSPQIYKYL